MLQDTNMNTIKLIYGLVLVQIFEHFQGMWIYLKRPEAIHTGEETRITEATYNVDYILPVPKFTRFVSLVLVDVTRVFTICELTVYGDCTEGKFGGYCENICHCEGDPCNTTTGDCPSGKCLPGYYGTVCDKECPDGTYGSGCREKCGNCFGSDICSKQSGRCPGQCASGYQSTTCEQECDDGFYGQGCANTCGNCYNGESCNAVTGHCGNGCVAAYQADALCKTECTPGTYGVGCTEPCGNCNGGSTMCVKTDGDCPDGCVAGYKGDTCKTECGAGFYGPGCVLECGNCLNGEPCDKKLGYCVYGCSDGYQPDLLCKTEMVINNYLSLAISGWVCVGIVVLVSAVGIFFLMRKLKRANQEEARSVSCLYEIPTTRNTIVNKEDPYSSADVNTQDHVFTNTGRCFTN